MRCVRSVSLPVQDHTIPIPSTLFGARDEDYWRFPHPFSGNVPSQPRAALPCMDGNSESAECTKLLDDLSNCKEWQKTRAVSNWKIPLNFDNNRSKQSPLPYGEEWLDWTARQRRVAEHETGFVSGAETLSKVYHLLRCYHEVCCSSLRLAFKGFYEKWTATPWIHGPSTSAGVSFH